MNCWDIVGTEPTGDIIIIKRAYAQKLKLYHPEDDPQGFQRLREAYEKALQQAKYIKKDVTIIGDAEPIQPVKDIACEQLKTAIIKRKPSFESKTDRNNIPENLVDQFMDKFKEIYGKSSSRKNVAHWQRLLEDEIYWNLDIKQKLNYRILKFLREDFEFTEPILPFEVWKLLNQHFFWAEQERELHNIFSEEFLEFIVDRITYKQLSRLEKCIKFFKGYSYIFKTMLLVSLGLSIIIAISYVHSGLAGGILAVTILVWQKISDKKEEGE